MVTSLQKTESQDLSYARTKPNQERERGHLFHSKQTKAIPIQ